VDRSTLIKKLKEDIASGRVVTIAGTGVSVAACGNQEIEGFRIATWTGLLLHGVKHLTDIGAANAKTACLLKMQVESGETDLIITAAETISQRMKGKSDGTFRGWLKDTIGGLTIQDRAVVDALAALPGVLATLNYDNLLEVASGRHAITWLKTDGVQDVLARVDGDAVLHLHGWYQEPESIVLGLGSYLAVKDHPHAKAVLDLFAISHTLLFVGCGDTVLDPNFSRLVEWGKEALNDVAPRHYLLCRTSDVAAFQDKLAEAPWLQPLDYGADYTDLAPFLRNLISVGESPVAVLSRTPTRANFDLAAYQQAMRRRYARLKLEELDPTTHDVQPLTLTGMFIPQSARECVEFMPRIFELPKELQRRLREQGEIEGGEVDDELLMQHRRAYLDQSPRQILEIVRTPALRRLVILGDPGSGKSSLLQYLLLDWAEKALPDLANMPLPLLIELRAYARLRHEGKVDGFLSYLHEGASVRWHFDREQLDAWLKGNPSWILFDGLDEVLDPELRKEVSTAIHRLADEYSLARVIVTSRIIGYYYQAWHDEEFRHFMLQELDERQIADFLARWHRAAYDDTSKGETKRVLLADAMEHSMAIRQLAGNPLLLTMMAILNRTQDLPRDRAELYEQCARLLLHQWKVDSAFALDPELAKTSLDYKDKRGLLLSVARVMRFSEQGLAGNLIDEDTLERTLADGLKGMPNLRPDRAARALIKQLRGQNFMLCSVGGRSYAFVHRSFLEYFCAVEIRECFQTEQSLTLEQLKTDIFGHWADETWHEVLCLLAGMLAIKFIREILEWLLTRSDLDDLCHHVFLAARCVGEVRRREELGGIEREILECAKALTRFDPSDDEGTLGARAVEMVGRIWREADDTRAWLRACAQSEEGWRVRYSAVQALARGWKNSPDTLPWLQACAQSDDYSSVRYSAVEALAWGWQADPETLVILKALARSDEDGAVRYSAVQALARGWKDDPGTLPWLQALAQSNEDATVRRSAVEALARGWQTDPETLAILKAHAQSDKAWSIRRSALEALAQDWQTDPETLAILKTRAQCDVAWSVRQAAVEALGRSWQTDLETLAILKARAQSDEAWEVREGAVVALARGWQADPETLAILKARAQSDMAWEVREGAVVALARGWKNSSDTLPWLQTLAQSNEDATLRRSALEALARSWQTAPETLAILKARAQCDVAWSVRQTAVEALARGWQTDPETFAILKARAQCDVAWSVRQTAVEALARGWQTDPETFAILKARAQCDVAWSVRQTAVEALARGWQTDPETLAILKARAQSDEAWEVREGAVVALARGWQADPDTLAILKARAQSDEAWEVRKSAVAVLTWRWKRDSAVQIILESFNKQG
jgi:HEAT repeat protein